MPGSVVPLAMFTSNTSTSSDRLSSIFLYQISAIAADCDKHSDDIECAVLAGDILFTGSDDGLIKVKIDN